MDCNHYGVTGMDGLFEGDGFRITDEMTVMPLWEPNAHSNQATPASLDQWAFDAAGWHQPSALSALVALLNDDFLIPASDKPTGIDDYLRPMFTDGEADLGEIVVTGTQPDDLGGYTGSGGRGGEPPADHPSVEENPGDIDTRPHYYFDQSRVGDTVCDIDEAWQGLLRNGAPGQNQPATNGLVVNVPGFGPVVQTVNWETMTVTNTTLEGHLLHPGTVTRQIISLGGEIYIETVGRGSGNLATANEFFSVALWSSIDVLIARYVDENDDGEDDC